MFKKSLGNVMNCRENPYYVFLMPNPPGVGTLLVFGWFNVGSWLMLGQRYSTSKLTSARATVAVEPTWLDASWMVS